MAPRIWMSPGVPTTRDGIANTMRSSWVGSTVPCELMRTSAGSVWSVIAVWP